MKNRINYVLYAIFAVSFSLYLCACAPESQNSDTHTFEVSAAPDLAEWDFSQMQPLDGRPTILIIGDSVSKGYTPFVQFLFPDYQVIHNVENAQHSRKGKTFIKEWADHAEHWDICMINHGLHDVRPRNGISLYESGENIRFELRVLKEKCDRVIWNRTTFIPANADPEKYPPGKIYEYTHVSDNVSAQEGVERCDLYWRSLKIRAYAAGAAAQNNVHYTPKGSYALALKIEKCIKQGGDF
jgi:hypothetical protein